MTSLVEVAFDFLLLRCKKLVSRTSSQVIDLDILFDEECFDALPMAV